MLATIQTLIKEAAALHEVMKPTDAKLVLSESCTGGLVSAALCAQPGISEFFCGSSVVYRDETKANWLGISRTMIQKETSVSVAVTQAMASNLLRHTPEANISAAITGYLSPGPKISKDKEGLVIGAVAIRGAPVRVETWQLPIEKAGKKQSSVDQTRWSRQCLASLYLLQMVRSLLSAQNHG